MKMGRRPSSTAMDSTSLVRTYTGGIKVSTRFSSEPVAVDTHSENTLGDIVPFGKPHTRHGGTRDLF